jgi:Uri superfamily endonuclease
MKNLPGTYALVLKSNHDQKISIGKLGHLRVRPGFYVYIGSAFGPGGLKARIAHHNRSSVRPHWHIDYLCSILLLDEVWYTYDSEQHEHRWADVISRLKGATIPMTGFGASDCNCTSHLFAFTAQPPIRSFRRRLRSHIHAHGKIFLHDNSILK